MANPTTTATLPKALQGKYALTRPLNGGPVYVFPEYGGLRIDFSMLTYRQAESLLARGWPGICRVDAAPTPPHQQRIKGAMSVQKNTDETTQEGE